MQADLVDRYLSRIDGVFEHLSELNRERIQIELDGAGRMRSKLSEIESVQQEHARQLHGLNLIRNSVVRAVESIPFPRDSRNSETVSRDQSVDEEVDTGTALYRLRSCTEELQRLVEKCRAMQALFSNRRDAVRQSLNLMNAQTDKGRAGLDSLKFSICERFPIDVRREAETIDQNSSEHTEVTSIEQFDEFFAQIQQEIPSSESIRRRESIGEALSEVVKWGTVGLVLPGQIGFLIWADNYTTARCTREGPCPGGGRLLNFINNSEYTVFFGNAYLVVFLASCVIGLYGIYRLVGALKAFGRLRVLNTRTLWYLFVRALKALGTTGRRRRAD